jgi:uncharacterized membrane protein
MDFADLLKSSWDHFMKDIVNLALFTLLGTVLCLTIVLIPSVTRGWFVEILAFVRNERSPSFDALWCFDDYIKIVLLIVIGGGLISLGYMLFVVPGVILSVIWMYAMFYIVDKDMGFIEALGASKDAVMSTGFLTHLVVFLVLGLLGGLGGPATGGIGYFFTTPFSLILLTVIYEDHLKQPGQVTGV